MVSQTNNHRKQNKNFEKLTIDKSLILGKYGIEKSALDLTLEI